MRRGEEGAALLTVLILVAVVGALATGLFDRLRLATRLTANGEAQVRARAVAASAEALLMARLGQPGAASFDLPVPGAQVRAVVGDAGNCINLNGVVTGSEGAWVASPGGMRQLGALLTGLGLSAEQAGRVAAATADWIDSDSVPLPEGGEDGVYARAATPYRTAGSLMAEASEWRAVAGVSAEVYARARPFVCALPVAEVAPVNVDTLRPGDAPVLAAMLGAPLGPARAVLAQRPPGGWRDVALFWNAPALQASPPPVDVLRQAGTTTRWYRVALTMTTPDAVLVESVLVDARRQPARLVARRWTEDE